MDTVCAKHAPKKRKPLSKAQSFAKQDTMMKIVKERLPPNVSVARDVQAFFEECCIEFVNMLSFESYEISSQISKGRLITPAHVFKALQTLGFEEYIGEVQATHDEHKIARMDERARQKRRRLPGEGITEEEAAATQQRLFAEARARMNTNTGSAWGLTIPATTHKEEELDTDYDEEEDTKDD